MNETDSIRTEELRAFSRVLALMSGAYGQLADWLESKNVTEIPGGGTPTAKRAIGYLGGFTGTVLKAYSKSQLGDEDGPAEIAADLVKAETATKDAAKKRPRGGKHDPSAPYIDIGEPEDDEPKKGRKGRAKK